MWVLYGCCMGALLHVNGNEGLVTQVYRRSKLCHEESQDETTQYGRTVPASTERKAGSCLNGVPVVPADLCSQLMSSSYGHSLLLITVSVWHSVRSVHTYIYFSPPSSSRTISSVSGIEHPLAGTVSDGLPVGTESARSGRFFRSPRGTWVRILTSFIHLNFFGHCFWGVLGSCAVTNYGRRLVGLTCYNLQYEKYKGTSVCQVSVNARKEERADGKTRLFYTRNDVAQGLLWHGSILTASQLPCHSSRNTDELSVIFSTVYGVQRYGTRDVPHPFYSSCSFKWLPLSLNCPQDSRG